MALTHFSESAAEALLMSRTYVAAAREEVQQLRAVAGLVLKFFKGGLTKKDGGYFAGLFHERVVDLQSQLDGAGRMLAGLASLDLDAKEPQTPASAIGRARMRHLFSAVADEQDRAGDCDRCGGLGTVGADRHCIQCGWLAGASLAPGCEEDEGLALREQLGSAFLDSRDAWKGGRPAA
jgi:hypothetical protein